MKYLEPFALLQAEAPQLFHHLEFAEWLYLDFALRLHQLQFGLRQLQLHLPELVLQALLLLVRLLCSPGGRRGHGGPHAPLLVEEAAALLTAFDFGLQEHSEGKTEGGRSDLHVKTFGVANDSVFCSIYDQIWTFLFFFGATRTGRKTQQNK